jgi:thioredoxin-like negative regulator of GroEL
MTYTIDEHRTAVVISAAWCSACGPFKRKLESQGIPFLSAQMEGEVGLGLSIATGWTEGDKIMKIAQALYIKALPTTLIFENRELVANIVGGKDTEAVRNALQK